MKIQTLVEVVETIDEEGKKIKSYRVLGSYLSAQRAENILEDLELCEYRRFSKDPNYQKRSFKVNTHTVFGVSTKSAIKTWKELERQKNREKVAKFRELGDPYED